MICDITYYEWMIQRGDLKWTSKIQTVTWQLNMGSGVTLFPMVGWWAVPARRCAMTRKVSGNIFGFTQRRCEVSDESRERILTLSHSPSVIKPSQAMGVCRGSRAFRLSMSPMCSRAAPDSSGIVRRILLFKTVCLLCWDVLCPDAFVICSLK